MMNLDTARLEAEFQLRGYIVTAESWLKPTQRFRHYESRTKSGFEKYLGKKL